MKKLLIYRVKKDFVIERVNEFNHSFKRFYDGVEALREGLEAHRDIFTSHHIEVSSAVSHIVREALKGVDYEVKGWREFPDWDMDEPSFMD